MLVHCGGRTYALTIEVVAEKMSGIYLIANPDKLTGLRTLGEHPSCATRRTVPAGNEWGWTHRPRGLAGYQTQAGPPYLLRCWPGESGIARGLEKEQMIFLLLRRLSPRARMITGVVLMIAGLVVVAVSAVAAGLLIHGIALTVMGAVMCTIAVTSGRRARRAADRPTVDDELTRGAGR